jgi:hypothetical protein
MISTRLTWQVGAYAGPAPFGGQNPGPHLPRRRVAHVLSMSTLEFRDPVLFYILTKSDDALLDCHVS